MIISDAQLTLQFGRLHARVKLACVRKIASQQIRKALEVLSFWRQDFTPMCTRLEV